MSQCSEGLIIYSFGGMQVYTEETICLLYKRTPGKAISTQIEGTVGSSSPQGSWEALLFQRHQLYIHDYEGGKFWTGKR